MKIINNRRFSKFAMGLVLFIFVTGLMIYPRKALAEIPVISPITDALISYGETVSELWSGMEWNQHFLEETRKEIGSVLYYGVLSTALNKIAYDTATWLASGDKGKKPLFLTEKKGEFLRNQVDNAAGGFIEALSNVGNTAFGTSFNLCEPNIDIKVMIGLGLTRPRLKENSCTFSKMKKNWEEEVLKNKDFLKNWQGYFSTGDDLGIALEINNTMFNIMQTEKENSTLNLLIDRGMKPKTESISGKQIEPTDNSLSRLQATRAANTSRVFTTSENIWVDAAKVFGNQYFLTLFERAVASSGSNKPDTSSPYDFEKVEKVLEGITNPSTDITPSGDNNQNLLKLVQPDFKDSSEENILSELSTCPDSNNAGTSNCVIDTNFMSAISDNLTVGQAINKGYLNQNGKFGFIVEYANNDYHCYDKEPAYSEGYPYRSMLILRKYRILPVGWELAAQYIHDNPSITHSCTLGDMVACFDADDEFRYVSDSCTQGAWCRGLVDPNWVVTTPKHICKSTGPGPEIVSSQNSRGSNDLDSKLIVKRRDYCADEQSCIHEKNDGNCEVYGYCVEEKRKWNFGTDSCDPNFNSCETYRDSTGKSVSYLENTLNNSVCTSENVGCTDYCEDYSFDAASVTKFSMEQNGVTHTFPATFVNANSSASFYNYNSGSVATSNPTLHNLATKDKGYLFIHYDTNNEVYSLGMLFDTPNGIKHLGCETLAACSTDPTCDCDGGNITFTFNNITAGNQVTVQDDAAEGLAMGATVGSGGTASWGWTPAGSDGAMIDMPQGDWSVTITPSNFVGINQLALAYDGGEIPLDMNRPVTISKNIVTGNFTCSANSGNKLFLDKDAKSCGADKEGCHQFIRTKSGLGTNLLTNSSFEDNQVGDTAVFGGGSTVHLGDPDIGWMANRNGTDLSVAIVGNSGGHQVHSGEKSAFINTSSWDGIGSYDSHIQSFSRFPVDLEMRVGATYTLSAWVYVQSGVVQIGAGRSGGTYQTALSSTTNTWERVMLSFINNASIAADEIFIYGTAPGASFYVDDIQLEEGLDVTNYKDYGQANVVYEKILPNYLAAACYRNPGTDYQYKDTHASTCDNFARLCNKDEVGCDMYTSVNTDTSVPAKVEVEDYCMAECVGYDQYMQHATYFSSFLPKYFIPTTAKECDAGSVGCEEFTNLDNVSAGGETREYYSYLRQCVKPGQAGSNCGEFYTWEGSSETGFQLRVHNLQVDDDNDDGSYTHAEARYNADPAVTEYDYVYCNELIYKLNLNSDCREFYNRNGELSYHLYTDTITCSADCHNFRMTKNNVVKDPATGSNISWPDCQALSNYADYHDIITNAEFTARGGECVFCKNGGTWNSSSASCLYNAIPSEGTQCSKEVSGCREYSGNTGSSIYNVSISNFEGSTQGWEGIGATTVITDNDSLRVNEEALRVQVAPFTIAQTVGLGVQRGKSYYLEFIAKAITANQFNAIYLSNGPDSANFAADPSLSMILDGQYKIFKLNLASLDHAISDAESLVIQADGGFMIDDIKLVEITDRYYRIEDSWQTPETCFQDIYGNPVGQLVNLGCDEYTDRAGGTFYLHNFKNMCQESAVGCEALIDTYNYSDYNGITMHAGDASQEVISPDSIIYAVYDNSKSCFEAEKGCQILGKPYDYGDASVFRPVYLVNNPDEYTSTLCMQNEKDCQSWTSREGNVYFKNPGNETCEYRMEASSAGKKTRDWAWFKTSTKRCDGDANGTVGATDNICLESADCNLTNMVCKADKDCGANNVCIKGFCRNACIDDKNDYPCPTIYDATIGTGGEGGRISTPTVDGNQNNWVGNCPSSAASCTELLDPVSNFSVNLLANGNFANLPSIVYSNDWFCSRNSAKTCLTNNDCNSTTEGYCVNNIWKNPLSLGIYTQVVKLKRNYIYRIGTRNNAAPTYIHIDCPSSIIEFNESSNSYGSSVTSIHLLTNAPNTLTSKMFYVPDGSGEISCTVTMNSVDLDQDYAEVKQVIVNYQLETGLDKSSCNGVVNRNEGCVLFNERKVTSKNMTNIVYSALNFDAYNTAYGTSPVACSGQNCNSNQIIKVTPDRTCDKWLSCTGVSEAGKNKESVCDGIGICDKMDKNGNCERFVAPIQTNYTYHLPVSGIYTAGDIYNMSGYVKVGYENTMVNRNTTRKSDDMFNFGSMQPYGGQTTIINSSFEDTEENRCMLAQPAPPAPPVLPSETTCGVQDYPADFDNKIEASKDWGDPDYAVKWQCDPAQSKKCETIDDPIENEKEKICFLSDRDTTCKLYAPDGRVYMKLSADNIGSGILTSSSFPVRELTDYVLSYYVNTLNLSYGYARILLIQYNSAGAPIGNFEKTVDWRLDWRREELRFRTVAGAETMRIELAAVPQAQAQGSVYFDKIDILESLRFRDGGSDNVNTYEAKDCRLYPKDDALSCDYYDNGVRYKGWTGYCLEYDRYPGWSNACLQWWSIPSSVDSVNAWCGDNKVGDEEDCDCPPIAGKEQYLCTYTSSSYGTSVDNQYGCKNCMWAENWCGDNFIDRSHGEQCDWNDLGSLNGSAPKSDTFQYTFQSNTTTQKITCENLPFVGSSLPGSPQISNLSGYVGRMFTDGNLGCFSHDGGKNYNSVDGNSAKCTYDTSYTVGTYTVADPISDTVSFGNNHVGFGCTQDLFDDNLASSANTVHTSQQCIDAGGQVVTDIPAYPGGVVIDASGQTIVGYSDFGNTFCKFTVGTASEVAACHTIGGIPAVLNAGNIFCRVTPSSPITQVTLNACFLPSASVPPVMGNPNAEEVEGLVCDVGGTYTEIPVVNQTIIASDLCGGFGNGTWKPYYSNGKPWTLTDPCTAHISCSGPPCVSSQSNVSSSHGIFQNLDVETGHVSNSNCKFRWGTCKSRDNTCYAKILEVGCY